MYAKYIEAWWESLLLDCISKLVYNDQDMLAVDIQTQVGKGFNERLCLDCADVWLQHYFIIERDVAQRCKLHEDHAYQAGIEITTCLYWVTGDSR